VVALQTATCDDGPGALLQGFGEQVLELADLVAGFGAGRRVIALDPQLGPYELIERCKALDACR
jgi:hypothetical protein